MGRKEDGKEEGERKGEKRREKERKGEKRRKDGQREKMSLVKVEGKENIFYKREI